MTSSGRKNVWTVPGVIQLLLGMTAMFFVEINSEEWTTYGVFLILAGLSLMPAVISLAKQKAGVVLADHFFVLVTAYLAYYVVGALLLPFGPSDQAAYSMAYYDLDATAAMRVAGINCIGLGLALIAGALTPSRLLSSFGHSAVRFGSKLPVEWVIALFLFVGAFSYLYVLQMSLTEQTQDAVVAGIWRTSSKLLLVAIVLATAHQGRAARWFHSAAVLLVCIHAVGGILQLNKSEVLLPLAALLLGYGWRTRILRIAFPGVAILLVVYLIIGSPVTTARNLTGLTSAPDWSHRISVLWDGIHAPSSDTSQSTSWSRFCYTPPQVAALDLFDAGQGGSDFEKIGWVFVPRILFPDKPIMTDSGPEFHYKISGNMNSSTGHGVFVNGYYNLGGVGVVIVGLSVGFILAFTSAFAGIVFRMRSPLWLPLALLGSYMAFRIDGHFLADFLGPFALLLYAVVGIGAARQVLVKRATI